MLLPYLVNWLQEYGHLALWFAIYVASVGVSLPIAPVLLAEGTFASQGDFKKARLAETRKLSQVRPQESHSWEISEQFATLGGLQT
jgi:hypothetical protein